MEEFGVEERNEEIFLRRYSPKRSLAKPQFHDMQHKSGFSGQTCLEDTV